MATAMPGLGEDTGVVAAVGERERHLVGEQVELEYRAPRRHVIALGADREDRRRYVVQRDAPATHLEAALGEIVIEEQRAQVLRMHARGHARGVVVPGHDVDLP